MKSRIKILEFILAVILNFVPLILFWVDGSWRKSISNYAYSERSYIFVFLVTISGSLFLFNGFGFQRHWYNIILGFALFGISITPHQEYPIIHHVFSAIFFVGSLIAIQLSSDKRFKIQKMIFSSIICIGLLVHFLFGYYSLLVAEWIAIFPISLHFLY